MRAKTDKRRGLPSHPHPREKLFLAVDIGGTKVEAGLVSHRGRILFSGRTPMMASGSPAEGLRAVRETIEKALGHPRAGEIRRIGVAVPGWIDGETGKVLKAANLPCWRNYPLAEKLQDLF